MNTVIGIFWLGHALAWGCPLYAEMVYVWEDSTDRRIAAQLRYRRRQVRARQPRVA